MDHRQDQQGSKRSWLWASFVAGAACVWLLVQARHASELWAVCSKTRNIYTVDSDHPRAECVVVRGTTILGVGDYGTSTY